MTQPQEAFSPVQQRSTIPRYYSIWRTLWARIVSGHNPAGSLLGTEVALAAEFGVSRVTLREALSLLEKEGLVDRRRSFGTFVSEDVVPRGVVEFTGYLEDIILQADSAETTYFRRRTIPAPARIAEILRVEKGSLIDEIRRLRTAADKPKMWLVDYLPPTIAATIRDGAAQVDSLLQLVDQSKRISWGHQSISARRGTSSICARLQIDPGEVVLYSDRVVYDTGSKPLMYTRMYYPGPRYSFDLRLGRIT